MNSEKPNGITANRPGREMIITWADGHTSIYPFTLLRKACPCAECRGGHENMKSEPDPDVFNFELDDSQKTRVMTVKPTGTYAITIVWEDGHDYGIYNWHFLRALCPCPECRSVITK
ncbi:MAG: DUF971 domain-containing protein [Chloroflexota bacterium]